MRRFAFVWVIDDMQLLEDRIKKDGKVIGTDILKVDMFLNHQIDVSLVDEIAKEFYRLFKDCGVTRILTVEASGIAIATLTAKYFNVPLVFAKKASHKNVGNDLYTAECYSFTHGKGYTMSVSKKYLPAGEKILIIDDFLADGNAVKALMKLVSDSKSETAGVGIAIEKGFQNGGKALRESGVNLQSLAIVESMNENSITFGNQNR